MKRLLIFDLDGTLIDSRHDLANSVNAARAHLGLPPITNETVYSYVGNGVQVLIRRALGESASDRDRELAQQYFLQYYREHMLDYTTVYPGTVEALERMAGSGLQLAVLTNKPVNFSKAIIDGLGLTPYFAKVYGGNSFEQKKPDPIGIRTLIEEFGAARDRTIMVGDSSVDIQTARAASVLAWGVSYGFQPETLVAHPPDWIAHSMPELAERALSL